MRTKARSLVALLIALCSLPGAAQSGSKFGGHFSATADVDTESGTRSMGFDIIVTRPLSLAQVQPYKDILAKGGQQVLLGMLRQSTNGMFSLGGLQYPINLIVAEKLDDGGVRYIVVTARNFTYQEAAAGGTSEDFPFAVAVFKVPDFGSGDGKIYPKASLAIDADGHVTAQAYRDRTGRLSNVNSIDQ